MMVYSTIKTCLFIILFYSIHSKNVSNSSSSKHLIYFEEVPSPEFYNDTVLLYKATEGVKEMNEIIMEILINRTNAERQIIKHLFKTLYELDLPAEVNRRLFGDFRKVMVGLLISPDEYYAHELYMATIGLGTDENALTEILIPMTKSEIIVTKAAFKRVYNYTLIEAVESDTSGSYKDFLIDLCNTVRSEDERVDSRIALSDAYSLIKASEGQKIKTKEQPLIDIFTRRSFPQMRATFDTYKNILKKDILETINNVYSGDFQYALLTLVKYLYSTPSEFYARLLNDALVGIGTNDLRLIRIIIGRSEIDLDDIKKSYKDIYGTELIDDVIDDTSGSYQKSLVLILKNY